jgi:thiol-disulfide isomerase/thioredoxin
VGTTWTVGLIFLIAIGCSEKEELKLDPGVSPFYPGPGSPQASTGLEAARDRSAGGPAAPGITDGPAVASLPAPESEPPLRPEDVERQLRIALRSVEKGDSSRAVRVLDRILSFEPLNREALSGRASVAFEQFERATAPSERAAALDKAAGLVRTLHRAYEKSTKKESALFAQVLYAEARMNVSQGQDQRALAVLREAYDGGFDPFDQVEKDQSMASLRSSQGYLALLKSIDDANLAKARERVKDHLKRPPGIAFDFTLPDLDGKPVSLGQLKGKVVFIDIWGTWCKPCREAIPNLIALHRKYRRRGLEIVGIDYEQNAPDAETARLFVKRFVQEAGIPYPCVMGDEPTLLKIPNFRGFPTSMVIDRSGKVRMLVTENTAPFDVIDATVQVLLEEPAAPTPAPAPPGSAKPK